MKIVTFNLRCDNNYDKENRWQFRKGIVLDRIESEQPDVIGVQECQPGMADFLKRHLNGYLFVGCGRDKDYTGENNMVGIRSDRFELMGLETFWLSPTPNVPGSRYPEQSDCPRVCTHVMLRPIDSDRIFHVYNTHLDHVSQQARALGATAIMDHMRRDLAVWPAPVLLMGDMNDYPDSPAIAVFMNDKDHPLINQTPNFPASWHAYGERMDAGQIDFILSEGFDAEKEPVAWSELSYGKYLSDHNALCAYLTMKEREGASC